MANYHFTTRILRASKGQCPVASAAYQAAEKLLDERLGKTFSYTHKEEVVYSEIMLPDYAPEHLQDRATLWNEVEKIQNKSNSRYARQFEFSIPIEWSREESIERVRAFIQENFVDKGMIVDWAFHDKPGNPHIHMMCPARGVNHDGSWAPVSKSMYALDSEGNKIPNIDANTGLQKVRTRKGKGTEKIWVRINTPTNDWDRRETLIAWRKGWAEYANQYLDKANHIDHRSYAERGIEKVPSIHLAPGMNDMEQRGEVSWQIQENRERKRINDFFENARLFIKEAKRQLAIIKGLILRRRLNEERRSIGKDSNYRRIDADSRRLPDDNSRAHYRATSFSERVGTGNDVSRESGTSYTKARGHKH